MNNTEIYNIFTGPTRNNASAVRVENNNDMHIYNEC